MPLNRNDYNDAAIEAYRKKLSRYYSAITVAEDATKASVATKGTLTYPAEIRGAPIQTPLKVITYTAVDGVLREETNERYSHPQDGFVSIGDALGIKEEPVIERKLFPSNKRTQETTDTMAKASGGYMSRFKR